MIIDETLDLLANKYPDAHCALHYGSPEQLLFATILSAQCTDERVNKVTAKIFPKYPTPFEWSQLPLEEITEMVRSTGFYKNKGKSIKSMSTDLVEKYEGLVPQDLSKLVELAGVGRKTANVVLGECFGIPSGIVVDTHVKRISYRFGFTDTIDPVKSEKQLQKIIPKEHWIIYSHWLISHGREVCKSLNPKCNECFLGRSCPKTDVTTKYPTI